MNIIMVECIIEQRSEDYGCEKIESIKMDEEIIKIEFIKWKGRPYNPKVFYISNGGNCCLIWKDGTISFDRDYVSEYPYQIIFTFQIKNVTTGRFLYVEGYLIEYK